MSQTTCAKAASDSLSFHLVQKAPVRSPAFDEVGLDRRSWQCSSGSSEDGRIFVLEYKGEHLITADEAKEKINIGQLWAAKSDGKGLFLMAQERDERGRSLKDQIAAALV